MRLDLGLVKNPTDLAGTDLAHQSRRNQGLLQSCVTPHRPAKSEIHRRTAGSCDDLVTFQGRDPDRPPATLPVIQALKALLLETPKPLPNPESVRPEPAGNRRDRFTFRGQQDHACAAIATSFDSLLSEDPRKVHPHPWGETQTHDPHCTRILGALH
jgi:hypothetical protein